MMDFEKTNRILHDLESGYDQMSDKFSATRKFFWRDLEFIRGYIQEGDRVLDFGCGNGRMIEILKDRKIQYNGVDVSQKLIDAAKMAYPNYNFQKISGQDSLSFSDQYFNKIISIAVFHHFPPEYAQKIADDLFRVTAPGGTIIISVWNLWQRRFWKLIFDPEAICEKIWQKGKYEGMGCGDIFIPFKDNDKTQFFDRYHHVYSKNELRKIFDRAGFLCREIRVPGGKNIIYIGQKP
jgi:ubiquinone/menaquinone biosynthesis C-methylase UbiE